MSSSSKYLTNLIQAIIVFAVIRGRLVIKLHSIQGDNTMAQVYLVCQQHRPIHVYKALKVICTCRHDFT
jgi:hypothetical protein